jgi:hypothetical protein
MKDEFGSVLIAHTPQRIAQPAGPIRALGLEGS